jgi:hypothetical protein
MRFLLTSLISSKILGGWAACQLAFMQQSVVYYYSRFNGSFNFSIICPQVQPINLDEQFMSFK